MRLNQQHQIYLIQRQDRFKYGNLVTDVSYSVMSQPGNNGCPRIPAVTSKPRNRSGRVLTSQTGNDGNW
jgi:3-deoxy-D-manno-octulosonic acid (KDO) 8-phosphate synthase